MDNAFFNFPFLGTTNSFIEDLNTKLNHDRYEVYVNGDFIGFKTLLTQNETVSDVNDFLHEQGFRAFKGNEDGDHYEIEALDSEEQIKQALQVYLQTR